MVIGGVQGAASKSAMPSGKPSTISLRYGSDGSSGVWHRQTKPACLVWPAVGGGAIGSAMRVPRVGEQEAQDANAL